MCPQSTAGVRVQQAPHFRALTLLPGSAVLADRVSEGGQVPGPGWWAGAFGANIPAVVDFKLQRLATGSCEVSEYLTAAWQS